MLDPLLPPPPQRLVNLEPVAGPHLHGAHLRMAAHQPLPCEIPTGLADVEQSRILLRELYSGRNEKTGEPPPAVGGEYREATKGEMWFSDFVV